MVRGLAEIGYVTVKVLWDIIYQINCFSKIEYATRDKKKFSLHLLFIEYIF